MKKLFIFLSLIFVTTGAAADFSGAARSYYLMDFQSGMVLVDKAGDELMIPSSMIKLMTAELVFQALARGDLKLDEALVVSARADYRAPALSRAARVCLEEGQAISVEDAITGLIVVSGGDVAIMLAERLAGTEAAFADMMTERARELGMEFSSFGNSSGLPNPDNLSTAAELAILAKHIIETYPEYMRFFRVRRFEYADTRSEACRVWARNRAINTNRLLFTMSGADGMKTGNTAAGGWGVVATANRRGRRMIAVVNGYSARNHDALAVEARRLLEYGYQNTFNREVKAELKIPVWYGVRSHVTAATKKPFILTFENGTDLSNLRVVVTAPKDIAAPINAGDLVGIVTAYLGERHVRSADIFATEDVAQVRFFRRMMRNVKFFLTGK